MTTAVFLHVGDRMDLPTVLVRSIKRHNPRFDLIQVTDDTTPPVEGVSEVARFGPHQGNLMTFRLRAFAALALIGRTWFLDTDMICNAALSFAEAGDSPITAVCRRELRLDAPFNPNYPGAYFGEHAGKRVGEAFPYLACTTLLQDSDFWQACLDNLGTLDPKFAIWFGDQEAMRNVIDGGYDCKALPEHIYACLPEFAGGGPPPQVTHYKGRRKAQMLERAKAEGLI